MENRSLYTASNQAYARYKEASSGDDGTQQSIALMTLQAFNDGYVRGFVRDLAQFTADTH